MSKSKNQLDRLINTLILKWWKPFWKDYISAEYMDWLIQFKLEDKSRCIETLRTITAKESLLWQFVCVNDLVDGADRWTLNARQKSIYDKYITSEKEFTPRMGWYRLIESALCDEDKLEEFLLRNIKV